MSFPPSLPTQDILQTYTYLYNPKIEGPVILGVDEAGRGPVIGPMVYATAFCSVDFKARLAELGFADSKILNEPVRMELMHKIVNDDEYNQNIGWATTIMTAQDISEGMLRPNGGSYNLNAQAHDTTAALIRRVLDDGVDVREAYIDTVGPPEKYQQKLGKQFPSIKFKVTKKADSLFPIVSCASICAKVTRDCSLQAQLENCGSGYPSDPNTVKWLKENIDKVFGWNPLIRYSWSTAEDMLEKTGHLIKWQEEAVSSPEPLGRRNLTAFDLKIMGYE